MKYRQRLRILVLAGLLVFCCAACGGCTGVKRLGNIDECGRIYGAWVAGHGDPNGVDTKAHCRVDDKGNLVSSQLAADGGMTKKVVPAMINAAGTVGSGLALGLTMPNTSNSGGSATASVGDVNVKQKVGVIQQQSIKTGGGHGHGQGKPQ